MSLIGYARVSTYSQSLDSQLQRLKEYGCEKIFEDKHTGTTARERTQLAEMLRYLRRGDTVVVAKLDRLARNLLDLLNLLDEISKAGASFKSLSEDFDTSTEIGKFVLHVVGSVAEYEGECIRQRTLEGIAAARAQGRVGGRPRIMTDKRAKVAFVLHQNGESMRGIAEILNVSLGTVHRAIKRERERLSDDTDE